MTLKQFAVLQKGGSIGQNNLTNHQGLKIVKTFGEDKESAKIYAKRMRKSLTKGEKSYYHFSYIVGQCDASLSV